MKHNAHVVAFLSALQPHYVIESVSDHDYHPTPETPEDDFMVSLVHECTQVPNFMHVQEFPSYE